MVDRDVLERLSKIRKETCEVLYDKKGRIAALKGFCRKKDLKKHFDKIKRVLKK